MASPKWGKLLLLLPWVKNYIHEGFDLVNYLILRIQFASGIDELIPKNTNLGV